jgi:hypothetical protein
LGQAAQDTLSLLAGNLHHQSFHEWLVWALRARKFMLPWVQQLPHWIEQPPYLAIDCCHARAGHRSEGRQGACQNCPREDVCSQCSTCHHAPECLSGNAGTSITRHAVRYAARWLAGLAALRVCQCWSWRPAGFHSFLRTSGSLRTPCAVVFRGHALTSSIVRTTESCRQVANHACCSCTKAIQLTCCSNSGIYCFRYYNWS